MNNYYGCAHELCSDDPRLEKYAKQREDRGFDDTELWNLDCTILKFILPRLKEFINLKGCYPSRCDSLEEWHSILQEMIDGFEEYLAKGIGQPEEKFYRALELFVKHFRNLWY